MVDIALGSVEKILKIAQQIKTAVDTAKENEKDFIEIRNLVARVDAHTKRLKENTKLLEVDSMHDTLEDIAEGLQSALDVVEKCQGKNAFMRYFKASDISRQLGKAYDQLWKKMMLGNYGLNVETNIALANLNSADALPQQCPQGLPDPDQVRNSNPGRGPLDVVIVYGFDCSTYTSAWYTVDDGIFWMVQEKLTDIADSCLGYIYVMLTGNTYTSDMKRVDPAETKATGYTGFARRRMACTKDMASGLIEAHKMISHRGYQNGIILFFSDGFINKGDFFDETENFISKVPVHTFTLGGDANNQCLHDIAANSPGGKFHRAPVPEKPNLSPPFSKLLDSILGLDDAKPAKPISASRGPLDVVIVYAFDSTYYTPAWYTVDDGVFWLVQEKLKHYADSCLGYIYVMSTHNTYTCDMKPVDAAETRATGYKGFARRRMTCTKNMASGLVEAHKMVSNRGNKNGIILFFSDGLTNSGDFFDGTNNFVSKVPVHTFTLGGDDTYNHVLRAIAEKSPGGTFNTTPVPERPQLSAPFSDLLDTILSGDIRN